MALLFMKKEKKLRKKEMDVKSLRKYILIQKFKDQEISINQSIGFV